jgi:uncharacterized protein (TIGR02231 family)
MRLYFAAILSLSFSSLYAGVIPALVHSTLHSVTVYRSGAEMVHTATAVLTKGNNALVIGDVSNSIDPASIRIGSPADITIMSASFSTDFLKPETATPLVKRLQDSIAAIKKELGRLGVLISSDNELLDVLHANQHIGGSNTGVSVTDLIKMMDYYHVKAVELRTELSTYNERSSQLKEQSERLECQVQEEEKKNGRTGGSIVLQLLSPMAGPCELTISYLTMAASWKPSYDLKVIDASDPLHLLYKAGIVQTSGIDWKQVKLRLSTSVPSQNGNAPEVKTWFLQFVEPVLRGYYKMSQAPAAAPQSRKDLEDVVVTRNANEVGLGDYVTVNEQQMDVVFDIDLPYDVPGNGKEQGVVLKDYQVPCVYHYFAAPRLDKDAYLLGQVPGWEKLDLLPGEANIMVEGTYIGKSFIDPGSVRDTLNLTLGRDKRIAIHREKVVDYSSVKFLGANKKQLFTYEITVKNNKREKVHLELKDQYPVSTNKDIEEELLESSGASVDKDTGILTWEIDLAAGESRKYRVSYSVKYPKDRIVNIH